MKTTWGEITVRDAHVHFFSHDFFSGLAAQKGAADANVIEALGWDAPDPDPAKFAARWIAELDRHHVASAAVIASIPGDEDSVAAAVRAFPGRLHGYFMVDPTSDGAASGSMPRSVADSRAFACFPRCIATP